MSLEFFNAKISNLIVDDRWDAVMFKAPHPKHRACAGWEPYVWREPVVGWATVQCNDEWVEDDGEHVEPMELTCAVIVGEDGELRPVPDCTSILTGYLLYVGRREDVLDRDEVVKAALAILEREDPILLEMASRAAERRTDLS
jgi:hypothetical protein